MYKGTTSSWSTTSSRSSRPLPRPRGRSRNGRVTGSQSRAFSLQAEDGMRDYKVTGVQTCALPISDVFLTPRNLLNIMWAVSILGIIALGQTMLLITCNFDMSVAFVVGLAGIITVLAQISGLDLASSMALGLAGGMAVGIANGLLVVYTGANPFLITLGTASLAYAISLMLTHSQTLYATIPDFNVLGRGRLFGVIHYSVVLFVALAVFLEFLLRRTSF